jgi:hypothetical protein
MEEYTLKDLVNAKNELQEAMEETLREYEKLGEILKAYEELEILAGLCDKLRKDVNYYSNDNSSTGM